MFSYERAEKTAKWLGGWGFEPLFVAPIALLLLTLVVWATDPVALSAVVAVLVLISPVWLPIYLGQFAWISWINYIRSAFWFKQGHVLLEVQLPQEVDRSPMAMELFLVTLNQTGGEATFIHRLWMGQFRPVWSLEIVSTEGRVKFYIYVRKGFKNVVEARIYGVFPTAQVREAEDYVSKVPYESGEYDLTGTEYVKVGVGALPIKTYVDWKLDKNEDQEYRIDPLVNILEFMGSIGQGEHLWLQIIMRGRKNDEWYGLYYDKKYRDDWKDPAEKKKKEIIEGAIKRAQEFVTDEAEKKRVGARSVTLLSEDERKKIEAIDRSLGKQVFECGLRGIYIAKKDKFNASNIPHLFSIFGPYNSADGNAIILTLTRGLPAFNYPWQDWGSIRKNIVRRNLYFWYKHRAYFFAPFDQVPVFLTTEELASVWHFPGTAVETPALDRVPSRVSEAPSNLPTL